MFHRQWGPWIRSGRMPDQYYHQKILLGVLQPIAAVLTEDEIRVLAEERDMR